MSRRIFAHAVGRWGRRQAENMATSALVYLLNEYASANEGFRQLLLQNAEEASIPEGARYEEQQIFEEGTIDAVGSMGASRSVLIEAKIDAVLQAHQVTSYPTHLTDAGVHAILVPNRRVRVVSQYVASLLDAGHFRNESGAKTNFLSDDGHSVVVIGWDVVLASLRLGEGEPNRDEEVDQLQNYIDHMTKVAFDPLTTDDLAPAVARRESGLVDVIMEAFDGAQASGTFAQLGVTSSGTNRGVFVGKYPTVASASETDHSKLLKVWCGYWTGPWSEHANTPFWIQIKMGWTNGKFDMIAKTLLERLPVDARGPRVFIVHSEKEILVALYPLTGVSRSEVVDDLVQQLRDFQIALDQVP